MAPVGFVYNDVWQRLLVAETSYRRARSLDPQMFEARLRLGRVLFLKRDMDAARREFESVANGAADERLSYLAHLFLGGVHQFQNDVADARLEYEAALRLAPQYQTPYVALSFLEQMAGRQARASELQTALAALPAPAARDPWWDYQNGMFDEDVLTWLRAHVVSSKP